jgi:hypothetical protein
LKTGTPSTLPLVIMSQQPPSVPTKFSTDAYILDY